MYYALKFLKYFLLTRAAINSDFALTIQTLRHCPFFYAITFTILFFFLQYFSFTIKKERKIENNVLRKKIPQSGSFNIEFCIPVQ